VSERILQRKYVFKGKKKTEVLPTYHCDLCKRNLFEIYLFVPMKKLFLLDYLHLCSDCAKTELDFEVEEVVDEQTKN